MTNTTLSAVTTGNLDNLSTQLNPFSKQGAEGYAKSVAFMGVMKVFGGITNSLTQQIAGKQLENLGKNTDRMSKLAANTITLPAEFVGMQGTDIVVSLAFGDKVKMAPEDLAQTLSMIIGLRIAHM